MKERANTIKLLSEVLAYDKTSQAIKQGYDLVNLEDIQVEVINKIAETFEELNIDTTLQEKAVREIFKGFMRAFREAKQAVA